MEATDADNLLEQFEEVTEDFDDGDDNTEDPLNTEESKTSNPKKTSNIFKAVQNHFAASAASTSTGAGGGSGKDNPTRKLPRIGKMNSKYNAVFKKFRRPPFFAHTWDDIHPVLL